MADVRKLPDGIQISTLMGEAFRVNVEQFEKSRGEAFLVGPIGMLRGDDAAESLSKLTTDSSDLAPEIIARFQVIQVPAEKPPAYASVGRESDSDIIIPDQSISRNHARIQRLGRHSYCVQDAQSRNGTFVDGWKVPQIQRRRPPTVLKSGCTIRFGLVEFSFLFAPDLYSLLGRLRLIRDRVMRVPNPHHPMDQRRGRKRRML